MKLEKTTAKAGERDTESYCYSLIFGFRGGTYIRQVVAVNVEGAVINWANELEDKAIQFLGPKSILVLRNKVIDEPPVPIDGCPGIWFSYFSIFGHPSFLHIVNTCRA